MKITPQDINGILGILPTPATADADQWTSTKTVNLEETAKLVTAVVKASIENLATTGTFGEGMSLLQDEVFDFVDCVLQTSQHKVPLFVGVNTLNTRETVERCRKILGKFPVDGFLLGRPMWLPMDDQAIVDYYKALAAALPGVALIPYDNPIAFKGKISPAVYRELAKIPEVVAAKHTGGPNLVKDLEAVGNDVTLLPIDLEWCTSAEQHPDQLRAAWSGNVACCPEPIAALSRAIKQRDWTRAKQLSERLGWATAPQFPDGDLVKFMAYSIQIGRGRFLGAGLINPGPARPPYVHVPQALLDGGLEAGRRMKQVQEEYLQGKL